MPKSADLTWRLHIGSEYYLKKQVVIGITALGVHIELKRPDYPVDKNIRGTLML